MTHCFVCGQECTSGTEPCESCKESLPSNPGALADIIYGLQSEHKVREAQIESVKGLLKAALGSPQTIQTDNGYRISFRQFSTQRIDLKRFRAEDPETAAAYSNETIVNQLYVDPVYPKF